MLINLCYLVVKGLLLTTESGEQKLNKYLDDQHMHRLFEKFVLGFYKKHYPEMKPSAPCIDWNLDDDVNENLPRMETDITLTYEGKTLIIDTKFYSRTMQTQYDKSSIISGNLYQIFTYVKNKDKNNTGNVSGMLLYAKTDEVLTPDSEYTMSGNKISVKSLDLSDNWTNIEYQLKSIVQNFAEQSYKTVGIQI
jgi:5-methylcytosine-specific restriction enzyme subunit McrC